MTFLHNPRQFILLFISIIHAKSQSHTHREREKRKKESGIRQKKKQMKLCYGSVADEWDTGYNGACF